MCMENADPSRCVNKRVLTQKHMVIGEVTPNFELAKPQGLCVHKSASFERDRPWLVIYRSNDSILLWFLKFSKL